MLQRHMIIREQILSAMTANLPSLWFYYLAQIDSHLSFLPHLLSIKRSNLPFSGSLSSPSQHSHLNFLKYLPPSQSQKTLQKFPDSFQTFPSFENNSTHSYQQKCTSPLSLPLSLPSPFLPAHSPLLSNPLLPIFLKWWLQSTRVAFPRSWFLEPWRSPGLRRDNSIPACFSAQTRTSADIAII